ncbi:MAG TPA: radical SAM protein [Chitinispirillaceae bacterium]|nr:radical SAM protein [Chitinispirillaceae bacterium]
MIKKPVLLHYYITNRCNSRCSFCSIWQDRPKFDAAIKDVEKNLKAAWNAGCSFVDFTGGEPLLHNDLPFFLEIAKEIGFITSVTTNCILFPERAPQLAGKVDLLHFSLDADTRDVHDTLHGVKSFDRVIESIDIARKFHLIPDLLFSYSSENIDHFSGVIATAQKKRIIVILDPIFALSGPETISPNTHEKAKTLARKKGVYLNMAHLKLRSLGGNHVREPHCKAVETVVVILPDNKLALPCYHHRSHCIPIDGKLDKLLVSDMWSEALKRQGTYSFCESCHINCYFDPSYTHLKNDLFWLSMKSKLKYSIDKYIWYTNPFPIAILRTIFRKKVR